VGKIVKKQSEGVRFC